jgi:molybdate transport system substrate-binding protein
MKKLRLALTLLLVTMMIFTGCGSNEADESVTEPTAEGVSVNISAAASLTDALNEIALEYAKESKDELVLNFAGSGSLVTQIQEGAPCDLFISASKAKMDTLENEGIIDVTTRKNLLGNTLTLIASAEAAEVVSIKALSTETVKSIAIGTPESVPAGKYAVESFESLGITEAVADKIVYGKDVRGVLDYVETGNVDCGIVYKTDALLLETGVTVEDLSEESHSPIVYPAAVLADAEQAEAATAFYEFIQGDYAKGVFEKYGFTVL